jgi:hypothetical protein
MSPLKMPKSFAAIAFLAMAPLVSITFGQGTVAVNLTGTITDSAGTPLAGAVVKLEKLGLTATSAANGTFAITSGSSSLQNGKTASKVLGLRDGSLFFEASKSDWVTISAYGIGGQAYGNTKRWVSPGSHVLALPAVPAGLCFFKVALGGQDQWMSAFSVDGGLRNVSIGLKADAVPGALAKKSATVMIDVLTSTATGYQTAYVSLSTSDSTGMKIKMLKTTTPKFSFFVTSMRALIELSKNDNGFGGDYRFGETGLAAGLRGADKICATLAEKSLAGSGVKGWRAFLSATSGVDGKQVNAIDRIGEGPWYDRTGRVMAPKKADLLNVRPQNGDPTIQNDLPNENGIPNHTPVPGQPSEDNHHTMTGSTATGTLQSASATCKDWTTNVHSTENGKPAAGFAWPRNMGGTGGGGGGSNWMTTWNSPGCAAGIEVVNGAGPTQQASAGGWIGGGGGYGGFYCFALNP